jgi:hypothetical protein
VGPRDDIHIVEKKNILHTLSGDPSVTQLVA